MEDYGSVVPNLKIVYLKPLVCVCKSVSYTIENIIRKLLEGLVKGFTNVVKYRVVVKS